MEYRVPILAFWMLALSVLVSSPLLADDFDPPTDVACVAVDGNYYPVTVEWTNNDPTGTYTEILIFRDGVLIGTLGDPAADSYTDSSGPGGALVYTVHVYSADEDCTVESESSCLVTIGVIAVCASEGDFSELELDPDVVYETAVEFEDEDLAAVDGTTDEDISPTEDGRIDVVGIQVEIVFSSLSVDSFEWSLTSPEGTEVSLWDGDGGAVEWSEGGVTLTDSGEAIPDPSDSDCDVETCWYAPPGELADFIAEDAQGEWTLEGTTSDGGTLHDWCLQVFADEYSLREYVYVRGDVNQDGVFQGLVDPLRLLAYAFLDADEPPCMEAADADGNGIVSVIIDALRILQFVFGSADAPPAPYPDCGRADPDYEYTGWTENCAEWDGCY